MEAIDIPKGIAFKHTHLSVERLQEGLQTFRGYGCRELWPKRRTLKRGACGRILEEVSGKGKGGD